MYSKGVSWIDDCRIPFVENDGWGTRHNKEYPEWKGAKNFTHAEQILSQDTRGRFPANILVSDDMLNDGIITKQSQRTYKPTDNSASLFGNSPQAHGTGIGDSGSSSRYYNIDKWFENLIK
jgi:hypothetical protein